MTPADFLKTRTIPIMPGDVARVCRTADGERMTAMQAAAELRRLGWRKGEANSRVVYFPPKS